MPDSISKSQTKKRHQFLFHREQQVGVSANQQLLLNILRRGVISYFSINYFQHKHFYNFFDAEKVVDSFLSRFEKSFTPDKEVKFQGYTGLINYQLSEIIELESERVWLTDLFAGKYFNEYIRVKLERIFLKE